MQGTRKMTSATELLFLAVSLVPAFAGATGSLRGSPGVSWDYRSFHIGDWPAKGFPLCAGLPAGPEFPHNEWQAPIDIPTDVVDRDNDSLVLTTRDGGCNSVDLERNGHTWMVSWADANCSNFVATWHGRNYTLKQLHFHIESENMLGGHHQDMEIHLVHQAADGSSLVIGAFLEHTELSNVTHEAWEESGFLHQLFFHGFLAENQVTSGQQLNPYSGMISEGKEFYSYLGSLTTPPCTPNLEWIVLRQSIPIKQENIDNFQQYLKQASQPDSYGRVDRPVQPLKGRPIKVGIVGGVVG